MAAMGMPMGQPGQMPMGPPPGGMPMGGGPGGQPQGDPSQMIIQMLTQLLQQWGGGEQQIAGEQDALLQTLSMLTQGGQPPTAQQGFAEPSQGPAGFGMGMPQDPSQAGMAPAQGY